MEPTFIPDEPSDWYTLPQVAKRLGMHRSTAWKLVAEGRFPLPTRKHGGRTVVSKRIYERYLNGEQVAS